MNEKNEKIQIDENEDYMKNKISAEFDENWNKAETTYKPVFAEATAFKVKADLLDAVPLSFKTSAFRGNRR